MDDENKQVMSDALGWLMEMEILNDPNVHNALMLNILKVHKRISHVDLVIDTQTRKMLIYLELTFLGRVLSRDTITEQVLSMMKDTLPSFEFRVTYDAEILRKSIEVAKSK